MVLEWSGLWERGVDRISVGDRVYTAGSLSGTYAGEALCEGGQVYPLSNRLSFEQGAGIYVPYFTAFHALFNKAQLKQGSARTLLVHGASGAVGLAAIQFCRHLDLTVIGTAGTEVGRKLVEEQGADVVLDHHGPDVEQRLNSLTNGKGVDLILEMLGDVNLDRDLAWLAPYGQVVVIGCRGSVEINPRILMMKDASIQGMTLFNIPPDVKDQIHKELNEAFECGDVVPVTRRSFALEDAASAHELVMEPGAHGKIVLSVC